MTSPSSTKPCGSSTLTAWSTTPSTMPTAATYLPSRSRPTAMREPPLPSRSAIGVAILSAGWAAWLNFYDVLRAIVQGLEQVVAVQIDEIVTGQQPDDPAQREKRRKGHAHLPSCRAVTHEQCDSH